MGKVTKMREEEWKNVVGVVSAPDHPWAAPGKPQELWPGARPQSLLDKPLISTGLRLFLWKVRSWAWIVSKAPCRLEMQGVPAPLAPHSPPQQTKPFAP